MCQSGNSITPGWVHGILLDQPSLLPVSSILRQGPSIDMMWYDWEDESTGIPSGIGVGCWSERPNEHRTSVGFPTRSSRRAYVLRMPSFFFKSIPDALVTVHHEPHLVIGAPPARIRDPVEQRPTRDVSLKPEVCLQIPATLSYIGHP